MDRQELDDDNREFFKALDLVLDQGQSLYLTGKAGTGKTTFLRHLRSISKEKKVVILAPTGVAAINAQGQTIHSFYNIGFGPLLPDDQQYDLSRIKEKFHYNKKKLTILKEMEILVIDEISMVRADLFDLVNKIMQAFRGNFAPFGGVQVVLIGDVFQLPPVVTNHEKELMRQFYSSPFFFSSEAFKELMPPRIELKKIYRQSDDFFIHLLNRVRDNKLNDEDLEALNERSGVEPEENERYITLCTHNRDVDYINKQKLTALDEPSYFFRAEVKKDFPLKAAPTEQLLELKKGAQVMFVKNDIGVKRKYFNGMIGTIIELDDETIVVKNNRGKEITVEIAEWENIKYSWNMDKRQIEQDVAGVWRQYPLKLAWAITVHKSQGLTFDHVIADLSQSFSEGQVYVALSRCRSLEGLVLSSPIPKTAIKVNPVAVKFEEWMEMNR